MIRRKLPPFAALRVFEAVARTLHFTRAADELGLTQAAVSRQIKALELHLGARLVNRQPGGNTLTCAGARLSVALREGMDRMARGVREVSCDERQTLAVSVAPFFSAVWLTPRLAGFIKLHPGVDIRLHHAYLPPDFERDEIDLGISWGNGNWPAVNAEKMLDGCLVPVCSHRVAGKLPSAPDARHLLDLPLYCEFAESDWSDWFAGAGIKADMATLNVTRVDDTHAMLSAALENDGFALMFRSLLTGSPYTGQLAQPISAALDTGNHYFLTRPSKRQMSATGRHFRNWIMSEIS